MLLPHVEKHSELGTGVVLKANGVLTYMFAISAAVATANGSLPELVSKSQEENGDSKAVLAIPAAISGGEPRNSDAALPAVDNCPVSVLSFMMYFDISFFITALHLHVGYLCNIFFGSPSTSFPWILSHNSAMA